MKVIIEERVLTYEPQQLVAWRNGDKSMIPDFVDVPDIVRNQPRYRFVEMFALRWYHENEGWLGFADYELGGALLGSARRAAGREQLRRVVPTAALERLLDRRAGVRGAAGEPDLFLYKADGSFKFAEVKKRGDRLRQHQLRCIGELMAVLGCEVDIVYLCEAGRRRAPKRYEFDIGALLGSNLQASS